MADIFLKHVFLVYQHCQLMNKIINLIKWPTSQSQCTS